MELRYGFIFVIGILLVIFLFFFKYKRNIYQYNGGKKIANTKYVKNSSYYKKLLKKYKTLTLLCEMVFLVIILMSFFLLARPTFVNKVKVNEYNRDIFLCMDVSFSVNELNKEIIKSLKDTVNNLKGERFGISIFNTTSVLLVPLTDDYDYVLNVLEQLYDSIVAVNNNDFSSFYDYNYLISGTQEGSELYGGSLIGDGLVSCVNSFSNLDEDRTRIIIFSTDNDVPKESKPVFSLNDAVNYSKKNNVVVYGISTKNISVTNKNAFRDAVIVTGGELFEESSSDTVDNIVKNIEKASKSLIDGEVETVKTDIPNVSFMVILLFTFLLFILIKKVNYYDN